MNDVVELKLKLTVSFLCFFNTVLIHFKAKRWIGRRSPNSLHLQDICCWKMLVTWKRRGVYRGKQILPFVSALTAGARKQFGVRGRAETRPRSGLKSSLLQVKLEAAAEPDESPEVDYFPDHHFLPVRLSSSPGLIILSPLMRERGSSPRCKELKRSRR